MLLSKLSIASLGLGTLLFADIRGFVHDSHDGVSGKNRPVKIYRKEVTGGIDTLFTTTNNNGRYLEFESNFEPDLAPGETAFVYCYFDTLINGVPKRYEKKLKFIAGTNYNIEMTLDNPEKSVESFTLVVPSVKPIVFIPPACTIWAFTQLYKNMQQPCITVVDTISSGSSSHPHYHDFFENLEKQDSTFVHGDSGIVTFLATIGDSILQSKLPFKIDTVWLAGMNLLQNRPPSIDTLLFPDTIIINKDIGLEQILVPDTVDSGQVIVPGIVVRNYGGIIRQPYLHCKINEFYHDSMQVTMPPGIDTFYFSPCTLNSVGNFLVTQYSVLQGDVNPSNDTLRKTIVVNPVGVVEEKLENKVKEGLIIKPNPAKNYVISSQEAVLYDALGRKIKKIDKGKNSINLNSGVYFVKKDDDIKKLVIYK